MTYGDDLSTFPIGWRNAVGDEEEDDPYLLRSMREPRESEYTTPLETYSPEAPRDSQPESSINPTYSKTPESSGSNDLSSSIEARLKGLRGQYQTNALEANQTPELNGTQVGISAVTKLLPLMLGMMIAKRRTVGASAGANAGLEASALYEKGELGKQENKAKKAQLLASQNAKDIETVEGQQFGLQKDNLSEQRQANRDDKLGNVPGTEMFNIKEQRKDARAKTLGGKGSIALTGPEIKDLKGYPIAAQSVQTAINKVKELVPQLATSESYYDKSGNFDLNAAYDIGKRAVAEGVFGADSPAGQAQAAIQNTVSEAIKYFSGAASSEPEAARIAGFIVGKGLVPATFPAQIRLLEMYRDRQEGMAERDIQTTLGLKGEDPLSAMRGIFSDIKSGKGTNLSAQSKPANYTKTATGKDGARIGLNPDTNEWEDIK